jgi:hypothetical protein
LSVSQLFAASSVLHNPVVDVRFDYLLIGVEVPFLEVGGSIEWLESYLELRFTSYWFTQSHSFVSSHVGSDEEPVVSTILSWVGIWFGEFSVNVPSLVGSIVASVPNKFVVLGVSSTIAIKAHV